MTYGVDGAVTGTSDKAVTFNGSTARWRPPRPSRNPTVYTEELWFNTTTTQGGKLIGFGSDQFGGSGGYDRHVYMFDDGRLRFGVWTGQHQRHRHSTKPTTTASGTTWSPRRAPTA